MATKKDMQSVIAELRSLDRDDLPEMPPPASDADVRAWETAQGWEFPPSYRVFLSLHNGWPLSRDSVVPSLYTGVSGTLADRFKQRLPFLLDGRRTRWLLEHGNLAAPDHKRLSSGHKTAREKFKNRPTPDEIRAYEAQPAEAKPKTLHEARLYAPAQRPFGVYLGQDLYFFIPSRSHPHGELAVGDHASRTNDPSDLTIHADFFAMLTTHLGNRKRFLAKKK